jgi:hypothetical protein
VNLLKKQTTLEKTIIIYKIRVLIMGPYSAQFYIALCLFFFFLLGLIAPVDIIVMLVGIRIMSKSLANIVLD